MNKLLLFAFIMLLVGCENDDSQPSNNNTLVGSWEITTLVSEVALDLNNDDTASQNIHEEIDCIIETINFESDGTWSGTTGYGISFFTELQTILCFDNSGSGTWSLDGSTLTITNDTFTNTHTITLTEDTLSFDQMENLIPTSVIATYVKI